jgi:cell shape-determining protein MreC
MINFFFIASQFEFKQLNQRLEQELVEKENLKSRLKTLYVDNESLTKEVIFLFIM